MITENLSTLKIHKLTKEQYERELQAGRLDPNAIYLTSDDGTNVDITVDATLTIPNQAADAKVVGDAISNLNTLVGDTTVSEQIDASIDAIDFDAMELITIEDIDTICGGTIRAASEVLY